MAKFIIFFFLLNFYNLAHASIKEEIIFKLNQINNLSFNFKQTIDEKKESGNCIIKYPKKIYCAYNNAKKKILVSNGRSLLIKNKDSETFYLYPLNRTPLDFLLDKNFLIKSIRYLKFRNIDNKYINFKIIEKNTEINIFFDKQTLNLIGWQTEDIYQNLTITFISSIKINQKINQKLFILPNSN
jgi:outer membrane lipoprotein-sorting protein